MSKEWFNFCLMSQNFEIVWEDQIENNETAIIELITKLINLPKVNDLNEIILVVEHTGIYVQPLVRTWTNNAGLLTIVPAAKVGILLGGKTTWEEKTDQLDARRLAEYGIRFKDKLNLWKNKKNILEQLQVLQRQRNRMLNALKILEVPANEIQQFDPAVSEIVKTNQTNTIKAIKDDIKRVEQTLSNLINQDDELKTLFKLINSIPGVGPVTAREVIIATSAFTDFTPKQAKAFAKYTGVVPLKRQSGKFKKRSRTTKKANKKIKALLTMGATSLIGTQSELGLYYSRKIKEGKAHFSVINAMRNKLILRIFAVVRNQTIYQKNLNQALTLP